MSRHFGLFDDNALMTAPPERRHETASDIIRKAYSRTYAVLETCPGNQKLEVCMRQIYTDQNGEVDNVTATPWWFNTLMRDAISKSGLRGPWHYQSAHNVTKDGKGVQMCTIEKIGTKSSRDLFCAFNEPGTVGTLRVGLKNCYPEGGGPTDPEKFVFLRDPLERFLSAFLDKCTGRGRRVETHCEPKGVWLENDSGYIQGLMKNKKRFFEAYVDTMPLKWDLHFMPQGLNCNGLYRELSNYSFVGVMGPEFYDDLYMMGNLYGGDVPYALEFVYNLTKKRNESHHNKGIEKSASTHVMDYFTAKTVRKILEMLSLDYIALNLPIPIWAEKMLEDDII